MNSSLTENMATLYQSTEWVHLARQVCDRTSVGHECFACVPCFCLLRHIEGGEQVENIPTMRANISCLRQSRREDTIGKDLQLQGLNQL